MDPNSLTEDQKVRLRTCESADELRTIAKEQGLELSDDQLEAVAGGESCLGKCGILDQCDEFEYFDG